MKTFIITCYHSLKDPIIEGLLLRYLEEINKGQAKFRFLLITFEQPQYSLSPSEKEETKKELAEKEIIWKPLKYRSGRFMLIKKIWQFLTVFRLVMQLKYKYGFSAIMGFTSISGSIAAVLSKLLNKPLILYCFEPHSLYQLDFGIWNSRSAAFKLLNWLERFQVRKAEFIVVPTRHSYNLVKEWGATGKIEVMPVSVDEKLFKHNESTRRKIRNDLLLTNQQVLLYLGKFDGIYYPAKAVIDFFHALFDRSKNYFLLVVSPDHQQVSRILTEAEVPSNSFQVIPPIPYHQINDYLSASDMGLLAVPSLPSQRYRTPIKTANYLLCGLPYIVNRGVAEDDLIAEKYDVGVVIDDLEVSKVPEIHKKIQQLLSDKKIRERTVEVGLKYRKLSNTTQLLEGIFTMIK